MAMTEHRNPAEMLVEVEGLTVRLGERDILRDLSIDVRRGEILGIVGGSGSGKSVLLRTIIGLLPKRAGTIRIFGQDVDGAREEKRQALERRWGVMFQHGALFSSLTVRQNIQFPIREALNVSQRLMDEIADVKLEMVGLARSDGEKLPSQLSGGMIKRVALARALALDPEFVLLDEPTSGLDPISAGEFDHLIRTLQTTLGLTVYFVTHDLSSLYTIADRIAVIADRRVAATGTIEDMLRQDHPWIRAYFRGRRGEVLASAHQGKD